MQTADRAIKIIKRENRPAVEEKLELPLKTENEIRREILNTITSWVGQRREKNKEIAAAVRVSGLDTVNTVRD